MKLKKLALIGMVVLATMNACGKKDTNSTDATTTSEGENATETTTTSEGKNTTETTEAAKRPSDYGSVKLGKYIGVEIPNIDTTVSDEMVESQINSDLQQDPNITEVTDRPVQDGDTVNIDYTGTKDGVAFDGGTAQGYDLVIGSRSFIEGFESGLVGHNIGDDVKLNLKFPEDYSNADLAGADVVFDVKINSISVSTPATLTDEWVNKHTNGAQTTVDAYRALVRSNLEEQTKNNAKSRDQYNALSEAIKNSNFKVKDAAVDYEYNSIFSPIQSMITQYNMTLEQYASAYGLSEDELKNQIKEQAENNVKQRLIIDKIFKKENMSLKDEDYQVLIDLRGGNTTKDDLIQQFGQEDVDYAAKTYKVVNFILDKAKRSDVTVDMNGETEGSEEGSGETTSSEGESSEAAK